MRKSRTSYYLSVKYIRKHEKQISAEKMAAGLLSKNGVDFGKEFKKHKPSNCKIPSNIDHVFGGNAICDLFCENWMSYNSSNVVMKTVYHTDRMIWMKSRVRWMN